MIFLTVGSMFPFDRLVQAVDELVGQGAVAERVVAQIGDGRYEPRHMSFDRFLAKPVYEERLSEATSLISHAGVGTIGLALAQRKPLLMVPRASRFNESVNDHQLVTARKFEHLGHALVAYDVADIASKLMELSNFVPRVRVVDRERMARRIGMFIEEVRSGFKTPL